MPIQRYSVNQHPVETLLIWIKSGEIAIPDIQRPFVWNAAKDDFEQDFGFRRNPARITVSDPNTVVCLQAVDYFL